MLEVIILKKIQVTMSLNKKKHVVMKAMRNKINIFMLQLLICYISEKEISIGANVDILKAKQEK